MKPEELIRERLALDNRFRLVLSWSSLVIAALLSSARLIPSFLAVAAIIFLYNIPFFTVWFFLGEIRRLRPLVYVLSLTDFTAITATVYLTGHLNSPFFYLYPVPFLLHAFHFDLELIIFDAIVMFVCYSAVVMLGRGGVTPGLMEICAGQAALLLVVIGASIATSIRYRKKELLADRGREVMHTTVQFLEKLNSLPPTLASDALRRELAGEIAGLLKPLGIFSRLWIVNNAWKTLEGVGEHPASRPATHHLPTVACPAFALRQSFRYHQAKGAPCPSERFDYVQHICVPILNEAENLGVLFLGSYRTEPWSAEEIHLFDMLSHSIALTLHRKKLFENLQEKVSELNFSFEVGATGLATFVGSTQSIHETTINVLDGVRSILQADRASLMIWDKQSLRLLTQWTRGGDFKIQSPMRLEMGEGLAGWALQTGEPYWAEYAMGDPHYVPSGQPFQSLICVPIYTLDHQPLGVINAMTLQTPRPFNEREVNFLKWFGRQAALAIENAQLHHRHRNDIDQLSEINQVKSQFLSLVSHDLRGPLTGVRGFCEILKLQTLGPLTRAQDDLLAQLERQVDLQERMVDDLLDFARMEKKQLSIIPARVDMNRLLKEEVDKSQSEARERNIKLSLGSDVPLGIPPLLVDGGRIRQVIWNLIHNALKFTPEEGEVTVSAHLNDHELRIDVQDSGVGISAEMQGKIFDKFFQVTPGGSRGAQGLGLGLAICKEIILAHNGRISARSTGLGQGTTISFFLPIRHPATHISSLAA